jgi:aryl sulfotransferase
MIGAPAVCREEGMDTIAWPEKTGELVMWVEDSRPWNGFRFRPDDIVISTWSKTGTTWVQQIVSQFVFSGRTEISGQFMSPWPDSNFLPDELAMAEAQTHRRFLKTHLPIENLVYSPMAKYVYVARDGRDTFWSWHNHHVNLTAGILEVINSFPDQKGRAYTWPDPDVRQAFLDWLDEDGYPNVSFFDHIRGWWELRHLPNLLLVHFNDLKKDMRGEIERIAAFLEIEVPAEACR